MIFAVTWYPIEIPLILIVRKTNKKKNKKKTKAKRMNANWETLKEKKLPESQAEAVA